MGKKTRPGSIKISGDEIAKRVESFKQLYELYSIPQHLQDAIKNCGYVKPTPVQSQVIPLLFDRREVICSAPTGSGKTLSFVLPIINQLKPTKDTGSFRAIILSPTRELAKQIYRETSWMSQGFGLKVHVLQDVKEAAQKFSPSSGNKLDILITTPNRLSSLLKNENPIDLSKLEWLILDECDRLFELGFKDDLEIIYKSCQQSDRLRRAMFSATLDNQLVQWAQIQMNNVAIVEVGGKNRATSSVEQHLIYVGNEDGKVLSLRELIMSGIEVPVLIFVETKERAKFLAQEFQYEDLNMDFIHSERDQRERDQIVTRFREGKIWFLVCTDLMGRGIDFKGVNVVINYDCPLTGVSYIHRIGRTGRAGRKGKAFTYIADKDRAYLPQIVKVLKRSGCDIPKPIQELVSKSKKSSKKSSNQQSKSKNGKPQKEGTGFKGSNNKSKFKGKKDRNNHSAPDKYKSRGIKKSANRMKKTTRAEI